jgi:hypothetical protein
MDTYMVCGFLFNFLSTYPRLIVIYKVPPNGGYWVPVLVKLGTKWESQDETVSFKWDTQKWGLEGQTTAQRQGRLQLFTLRSTTYN